MSILLFFFIGVSLLALAEALYSFRAGIEFLRLFRKVKGQALPEYRPPASLILPCRGLDPGFSENMEAFFKLEYPNLQLLFVTGTVEDPACGVLQRLSLKYPSVRARLLTAGIAENRGQKVHNLLQALESLREKDQVIAFADSDIRPDPLWLRRLIGTLQDRQAGMSTGYRWYLPGASNLGSVLRSVWNSSIVSLLREKDSPFAWGGAMAIRREVFEECRVSASWQNVLSDDLAISEVMHRHSRPIYFQPAALAFSYENCSLRDLLRWSYRQTAITRIYHPRLWMLAVLGHTINSLAIWGGGTLVLLSLWLNGGNLQTALLAALVCSIYLLGILKAWLRLKAVQELFSEKAPALRKHRFACVLWGPLSSLLSCLALGRSALSRVVEWRGIRYRMTSSRETLILSRSDSYR